MSPRLHQSQQWHFPLALKVAFITHNYLYMQQSVSLNHLYQGYTQAMGLHKHFKMSYSYFIWRHTDDLNNVSDRRSQFKKKSLKPYWGLYLWSVSLNQNEMEQNYAPSHWDLPENNCWGGAETRGAFENVHFIVGESDWDRAIGLGRTLLHCSIFSKRNGVEVACREDDDEMTLLLGLTVKFSQAMVVSIPGFTNLLKENFTS